MTNIQEAAHYERVAAFWELEAQYAKQYGGEDNEATAKIYTAGAKKVREMAAHFKSGKPFVAPLLKDRDHG
jgi:hypothetical protein